jgi:HSP20 family protein
MFHNHLKPNRTMFHHSVENLLSQAMHHAVGFDHAPAHVAVNITETGDAFTLHLAAPGYQKAQFSIKTEPKNLIVTAKPLVASSETTAAIAENADAESAANDQKAAEKTAAPKTKWLRHEFTTAGFERKFHLPENVNITAIVARYENGILEVTLPKRTSDAVLHREVSVV